MGKGSGLTRKSNTIPSDVSNYIKAFTSKGGPDYSKFYSFDTTDNQQKFEDWLKKEPKVTDTVYRGGYMLSGDVVENLAYGGWEGKTITMDDIISKKAIRVTSFSLDKRRVLSYTSGTVAPKPNYDKFENENERVMFIIETKGKNFVDISKYSHYKEEQEVVGMKDAKFKFVDWDNKGSWIEVKLREV